jgi:hypothetical protein
MRILVAAAVAAAAVTAGVVLPSQAARASDLHQELVRQSIALEQIADGQLDAAAADAVLVRAETLLAQIKTGQAGIDRRLADKAYHLRGLHAAVRDLGAAGRTASHAPLPLAQRIVGADALDASCAAAIPLREGQALRLPIGSGSRVWLRVAASGDAPLALSTRGSTLDPALSAFHDCRVADREPFATADDSHGLQAELALLPTRQTFWYVRADNLSGAGELVVSALRAVAFSGRVTRSTSGAGIAGVRVALFRNEGTSYYFQTSSVTDATGAYTVAVNGSGTYALRTGDDYSTGLPVVHQAYDGFRCSSGNYYDLYYCGITGANFTPITLTDPGDRVINFALDVSGSATGTLTSSLGGPVAGASVTAHGSNGYSLRETTSDALGRWRLDGLPNNGVYITAVASDHARTLHAGIECSGPYYYDCNFPSGTLVSVPYESLVRVDMTLRRQQFVEVALTVNGAALPTDPYGSSFSVNAALLNTNGAVVAQGAGLGAGRWRIGPLAPGSYRLRVTSGFSYPRLFPAVECASDCIAELGQAQVITVAATDTVVTRSMDLRRYPAIAGQVTTQEDASPISGASVHLSPVSGNYYSGYSATTNQAGAYSFDAVAPGSYILRFMSNQHADEVHDNLPCNSQNPGIDCPGATLITVGTATPDRTINAALVRSATVSGRISTGGQPYTGYSSVYLLGATGNIVASWSAYPGSDGRFTVTDVPNGSWLVAATADYFGGYLPQLYPGVDCPASTGGNSFASCPLAQATPVQVQAGAVITGIDFALRRNGSRVIRLLNAFDDTPLAGVMVDVWNANGQRVDSRATDATGRAYSVGTAGGVTAAHALSTDNSQGLINEVYQDLECANGSVFFGTCALTGYTPVMFPAPAGAPDIVIRIARPVPIFGGSFEQ